MAQFLPNPSKSWRSGPKWIRAKYAVDKVISNLL